MGPRDLVRSSHSEREEFREVFKKMGTLWMRAWTLRTPLTRHGRQKGRQQKAIAGKAQRQAKTTHRAKTVGRKGYIHTQSVCILCYDFCVLIMQAHKYEKVTGENAKVQIKALKKAQKSLSDFRFVIFVNITQKYNLCERENGK